MRENKKNFTLVKPTKPTEDQLGTDWTIKLLDENGGNVNNWSFKERHQAEKAYDDAVTKGGQEFIVSALDEWEDSFGSTRKNK